MQSSKKNIAIDAGGVGVKDERLKGGIYTISVNFLKELGKIDKKNTYLLYSFDPIEESLIHSFGSNFKNIIVRPSRGWNKIWLSLRLRMDKPDVFLALNQTIPTYHSFKIISFIHGLDFGKDSYSNPKILQKLRNNTEYCIKNSDAIITVSKALRNEIENKYKVNNISVLHPGISPVFSGESGFYQCDTPYFLFVGSLKSSKNIPTLLETFSLFLKTTREQYQLILSGSDKEKDEKIDQIIEKLNLNEKVFFTLIENENLPKYYKGAVAFVSPSLHESFGLPFLEAMACGCPVIGSNRGGIPEVVGDAGILVDPLDTKALADSMIRVVEDKKLRDRMIKKGLERAKKFSWESFARQVYEVINSV